MNEMSPQPAVIVPIWQQRAKQKAGAKLERGGDATTCSDWSTVFRSGRWAAVPARGARVQTPRTPVMAISLCLPAGLTFKIHRLNVTDTKPLWKKGRKVKSEDSGVQRPSCKTSLCQSRSRNHKLTHLTMHFLLYGDRESPTINLTYGVVKILKYWSMSVPIIREHDKIQAN